MKGRSPGWVTIFVTLPDPRVERTRRHKLVDIVTLVLVGVLGGCKAWDELHDYVASGEEQLREILELPNGIPSADTLRRVMGALDREAFRTAFMRWARGLCRKVSGDQVAIDGKTVRGALSEGLGSLHLVNAWATESGLVLGQLATDAKSNEISAIPELIKQLDLCGTVVSIDAMGCQKTIAKEIREAGADYLFGLKGNQPTLHQEALAAFDETTCAQLRSSAECFHESCDKGHGRLETRRVYVLRNVDWLTRSDAWLDLKSLVLVESERTLKGETSTERRAYLSSAQASAERFGNLVRNHWQVENKLHWRLDMAFGEDHVRIGKKNGAENMALLRKLAMNMLSRVEHKKDTSLVMKMRMTSWSFPFLLRVLAAGLDSDDQVVLHPRLARKNKGAQAEA
jgi:predicted transposase YbfD/YdcC